MAMHETVFVWFFNIIVEPEAGFQKRTAPSSDPTLHFGAHSSASELKSGSVSE